MIDGGKRAVEEHVREEHRTILSRPLEGALSTAS